MNLTLDYNYDTYQVFNYEKGENETYLTQWCEIKDQSDVVVGNIQYDCGNYVEFTEKNFVVSEDEENALLEEANTIMLSKRKEWKKENALERIRNSVDFEEIEKKAMEIARVLGEEYKEEKYLILSNTLFTKKSISILDAMVFLQISLSCSQLSCSQKQSSEIIDMFFR